MNTSNINTSHQNILSDISYISTDLSTDENKQLFNCAVKIRQQLQNQIFQGQRQYESNVEIIDKIIAIHSRNSQKENNSLTYKKAS